MPKNNYQAPITNENQKGTLPVVARKRKENRTNQSITRKSVNSYTVGKNVLKKCEAL